jgi:hypothetical protein
MRGCIVPDAVLCGVSRGRSVVGGRRREVDVAARLKHMLRLRRFIEPFWAVGYLFVRPLRPVGSLHAAILVSVRGLWRSLILKQSLQVSVVLRRNHHWAYIWIIPVLERSGTVCHSTGIWFGSLQIRATLVI